MAHFVADRAVAPVDVLDAARRGHLFAADVRHVEVQDVTDGAAVAGSCVGSAFLLGA